MQRRAPSGIVASRVRCAPWGAVLALWLLAGVQLARAQDPQVPYTVQIAALSDAEAAIGLSGALLRDGFPGYVVRAEGAAGAVYRVRVAAFGDRASADRYAREIGERYGGAPQPALAEAIPGGILPLAPARRSRVEGDQVASLLAWGDGFALRVGAEDALGSYTLLPDGGSFEAWWAAPDGAGRAEVVRIALDGAEAVQDDPAVRDALFRQRVALVADANGLDAAAIEAEAVQGEPGERFVIVHRGVAGDGSEGAVRGVLRRGGDVTDRSVDAWIGEPPVGGVAVVWRIDPALEGGVEVVQPVAAGAPEDVPPVDASVGEVAQVDVSAVDVSAVDTPGVEVPAEPDVDVRATEPSGAGEASSEAPTAVGDENAVAPEEAVRAMGVVSGDAWFATVDGAWTRLQVNDGAWRALVGTPRAGIASLLLVSVDDGFDVVQLLPR